MKKKTYNKLQLFQYNKRLNVEKLAPRLKRIIQRNMEARSRNCFYAACQAHAPYYIVIYGLFDSTIFFRITSKAARFPETLPEHKMRVLVSSTIFVSNISHYKKNSAR